MTENEIPKRLTVRIDTKMAARLEKLLPDAHGSISMLIRGLIDQALDQEESVPIRLARIEAKLDRILLR